MAISNLVSNSGYAALGNPFAEIRLFPALDIYCHECKKQAISICYFSQVQIDDVNMCALWNRFIRVTGENWAFQSAQCVPVIFVVTDFDRSSKISWAVHTAR